MIYTITALETSQNGKPLPGATVSFAKQGQTLVTLMTGPAGSVSIDDQQDGELLQQGVQILVSKPGYSTSGAPAANINPETYFILDPGPTLPVWLLLAGGVGVLYWLANKK